jgi:hypothetical protein
MKLRRVLYICAVNLLILAGLLLAVEGFSSLYLAWGESVMEGRTRGALAERAHTVPDGLLGWVNKPNVSIPDMYGPGLALDINAQGFRGTEGVSRRRPRGKVRLICSGDSFTLGYGVGNSDTWCQRLSRLEERIDPVNMGQGGYGVGQAFLWYRRDGTRHEHDAHVLALITTDIERLRRTTFLGIPKPRLRIRDAKLVLEGVPVPRVPIYQPVIDFAWRLKVGQFIRGKLAAGVPPTARLDDEETRGVLAAILAETKALNDAASSLAILLYLPVEGDYSGTDSDPWRQFLKAEAAALGIEFIDLVAPFRALPANEVPALFIQNDIPGFPLSKGPYTARGNAFVAERLLNRLRKIGDAISFRN